MNEAASDKSKKTGKSSLRWLWTPLSVVAWPFVKLFKLLDNRLFSYITGRVLRDESRVYSVRFVYYGDAVYLHPMIWGSLILYLLAKSQWLDPGWLLLAWFTGLFVCFLTIMYNFNVIKMAVLGVGVVALFSLAYVANVEFAWNPLNALAGHLAHLEAKVSPGFYVASAYIFIAMICAEVLWAWLFHRVEIDESYVYEHQFLSASTREPIFARGLRRETKDLLELLLLGAADIRHRTKNGYKRYKNVPFASLWLGTAIDSLLDYRRPGQLELERGRIDESDQARITDAFQDMVDEEDLDGGGDDAPDDAPDDGLS